MSNLCRYLEQHGLPACPTADGSHIVTVNEYLAPDHSYHAEPITIPATWAAVREFLGY